MTKSVEKLRKVILKSWSKTPAEIVVNEIAAEAAAPDENNYPRNRLYIGVILGIKADTVIMVKNNLKVKYGFTDKIENLKQSMLQACGFFPKTYNPTMCCKSCGTFSTRISGDNYCYNCAKRFFTDVSENHFDIPVVKFK
jgi:hypothetical protein